MPAKKERVLRQRTVYEGPIFKVEQQEVSIDGVGQDQRDIVHHADSVVILPLVDDDHVLIEKQWRAPVADFVYEFPAGKIDARDEGDPSQAAVRELNEELRMAAGSLQQALSFYQAVGFSDGLMTLFIAKDLKPLDADQRLSRDFGEELDLITVSFDELGQWLRSGRLVDQKTILAYLYWAQFGG